MELDFTLGFRGFAYPVPKTASRVHVHISRLHGHVVGSVKYLFFYISMHPKIEKPKTQQSFAAGCSPGGIPLRGSSPVDAHVTCTTVALFGDDLAPPSVHPYFRGRATRTVDNLSQHNQKASTIRK